MPAIQPARLKKEVAQLGETFERPAVFVRGLHNLLEFYADRAHRPGQAGETPALLACYHVRPPVLRQLIQGLGPLVASNPPVTLQVVDALWEQPYLELRLLAAALLGRIPVVDPDPVVKRVQAWSVSNPEERVMTAIADYGLACLRQEAPLTVIRHVEEWLESRQFAMQRLGLCALLPLAEMAHFDLLPVFYRLLQPFIRNVSSQLRADVLNLVETLAHRSPRETAYWLRQSLEMGASPDVPWFVRQSLPAFPADIQENLRSAVRGMDWKPSRSSNE